jgi:hypothetical protein
MQGNKSMKTITNITYPAFALCAFAYFTLAPLARAVCQEGCLTNQNTVLGDDALFNNTSGYNNTATGFQALSNNLYGFNNTAIGSIALYYNTTGNNNTATGVGALYSNSTGINNTATGIGALTSNTTGVFNTANGFYALVNNTTGSSNTATGNYALERNRTGDNNIAVGYSAGSNLTCSDNIDIGNVGVARESGIIRIGTAGTQNATFNAGIREAPIAGGVAVGVDANGQLGVKPSSARYKKAIQPMDKASEAILALKPVTFCYEDEFDPEGIPQFGLVAEDVEKVNPDLVSVTNKGNPIPCATTL